MAEVPWPEIRIAALTVSDRCSRGEATDASGPEITRWVTERQAILTYAAVVPDEHVEIVRALLAWCGSSDIVLTTGGTGFTPRDITPEATMVVIEREAPGIAELLRARGVEKTPFAVNSRGRAGIRGGALIINLPGSPRAVREGLEVLEPLLPHLTAMLRGMGEHH